MKLGFFITLIIISLLLFAVIFLFGYFNCQLIKTKKIVKQIKTLESTFNDQIINTKNFKKLYDRLDMKYNKNEYDFFWVNLDGFRKNINNSITYFLKDESLFNFDRYIRLYKHLKVCYVEYSKIIKILNLEYNRLKSLMDKISNNNTECKQ